MKSKKKSFLKSFNEKIPNAIRKSDFIGKSKFMVLIPVCLLLIASIFILCFGFNLSFDLQDQTSFNVEFNTTLSNSDYSKYEDSISKILQDNKINNYKFEKIGEGTSNKLLVKFLNKKLSSSEIEEKYTNISNKIEELTINENATMEVSEYSTEVGSITKYITNLSIFLSISIVILFIYIWIRFDFMTALSSAIMMLTNVAVLTSVYAIFRLPIDTNVTYNYLFVTVLSLIFFAYMSDRKRIDMTSDETKNLPNSEIVYNTLQKSLPSILTIVEPVFLATLVLFIVLIFLGSSLAFTMLGFVACMIISLYSSMIVANSFWSLVYNRKNDKRLQARIDRIRKKEQQAETKQTTEEKEKIIV